MTYDQKCQARVAAYQQKCQARVAAYQQKCQARVAAYQQRPANPVSTKPTSSKLTAPTGARRS